MSKAKFGLYVDTNYPVDIVPYMDKDEEIYPVGTLLDIKQQALIALDKLYLNNKEYIYNLTEKSFK